MARILNRREPRIVLNVRPVVYFRRGAKFAANGDYPRAVEFFHKSGFHEDGARVILQDFQVEHAYDLLRRKFEHKVVVSKLEKLIETVHTGLPDTISSLRSELKEVIKQKALRSLHVVDLRSVVDKEN